MGNGQKLADEPETKVTQMNSHERMLNRDLIIGWSVIVIVLFFSYSLEVVKQERTLLYLLLFMIATAGPAIVCGIFYWKNPYNYKLRYGIVIGYFIMYLFVMASAKTTLVFVYILPLLSLLILYHQPKLILYTGIGTAIVNVVSIAMRFLRGEINLNNSKDVEIQAALLLLCFGSCYVATKIYDGINRRNYEYMDMLDKKSKQIQNMTFQTIETIANTIDAKDEYTQGHSRRVSNYAAQIAKEMGMDEEQISNIRFIALLHDIGKIGVPDSVLNKPGRLTDAEYELMKQHTVTGGEILKDIGMLPDLDVGAKYHHERYDGKGYPNGLKGEEIPLTARIICMADSFDAMTSNRVYRKHLSMDVVMEEIRRCRGTQFDPKVADAFLSYLSKQEAKLFDSEEEKAVEVDAGNKILQKFMADQSKQATENAEKDDLTKVYNRSAGERYITLALRNGNGCLFLMNLDNMRQINRKFGFRRGDYYLQQVVHVLCAMSEEIIISRFGGDEFLCYMPKLSERDEICRFMDQLLAELKECERKDPLIENISVSVGITIHDKEKQNLHQLLQEADKALYHVKQATRNDYYFFREIQNNSDDVSKAELVNLIDMLRRKDNFSNESILGRKDFSRVFRFVSEVANGGQRNICLLMFTAMPKDENSMWIEDRDEAMRMMEQAIMNVIKDESVMTRYSSVQRIVIMADDGKDKLENTAKEILRGFYRLYDKKDVEMFYDIASVQQADE